MTLGDWLGCYRVSNRVNESVSCLTLQPHRLQPAWLLCPWDSPGKNTGVGCHALLQGIFPTWGSNPGVLLCRQILLATELPGRVAISTYNEVREPPGLDQVGSEGAHSKSCYGVSHFQDDLGAGLCLCGLGTKL